MERQVKPPELQRQVLTAEEVGQVIGCSAATFLNKRRQLEEHGFPPKLPGCNGWSRPAVMRWISTNGASYQPGKPEPELSVTIDPIELDDLTSRLEADYAGTVQ